MREDTTNNNNKNNTEHLYSAIPRIEHFTGDEDKETIKLGLVVEQECIQETFENRHRNRFSQTSKKLIPQTRGSHGE